MPRLLRANLGARDLQNFTLNMVRNDGSQKGEGSDFVDSDGEKLSNLPAVAFKNNDPIALRPSCELQDILPVVGFCGSLARAFDENLNSCAQEWLIVFFADSILNG